MAKKISPGDIGSRNHPDWSKVKGAVPPPSDILNPPLPPPANSPAPANDKNKDL